jgi:alkylation response protein AidB-like acyl-CoA dehydrogenase
MYQMEQSETGIWEKAYRAASDTSEVSRLSTRGYSSVQRSKLSRLAKMIAHCEADQAWLENITYQMTLMPYKQQSVHLAGPIGLLKMFATRSAHECADEAVQIFGGRALTQTGMGKTIEMFHRT